jgi:hypothetical protein
MKNKQATDTTLEISLLEFLYSARVCVSVGTKDPIFPKKGLSNGYLLPGKSDIGEQSRPTGENSIMRVLNGGPESQIEFVHGVQRKQGSRIPSCGGIDYKGTEIMNRVILSGRSS